MHYSATHLQLSDHHIANVYELLTNFGFSIRVFVFELDARSEQTDM